MVASIWVFGLDQTLVDSCIICADVPQNHREVPFLHGRRSSLLHPSSEGPVLVVLMEASLSVEEQVAVRLEVGSSPVEHEDRSFCWTRTVHRDALSWFHLHLLMV